MAIYKVSYVVISSDHPGTIVNRSDRPFVGELVTMGPETFEVIEVLDLLPHRGQFHYVHVTCKQMRKKQSTTCNGNSED